MNPSVVARVVNRFEKAVRSYTLKGSRHPEDQIYIENEYKLAKRNLMEKLNETK